MGRSRRDYCSYRGRRTFNDVLKVIAVVLLILVVGVLGLYFFGRDYLARLEPSLPFAQPQGGQTDPGQGGVSVEIRPSGGEEEETPLSGQTEMVAVELPRSAVLDGTASARLEEAGANALILAMKDEQGQLGWSSEQELAGQGKVNDGTQGINQALEQWNQGSVYTVARVCCFRDNTLPYQRNSVALRASYGNWRDELGLRWLNPDNAQAQSYLAGLCGELAQMGFDEILLDCCGFPDQGNLEVIAQRDSYLSGQFAQTVEGFLAQVKQAVEPYGTVLSIRCSRQSLTAGEVSGLTAQVLEEYAGRIWVTDDGALPQPAQLLEQAGISRWEERLVTERLGGQDGVEALGLLPETAD